MSLTELFKKGMDTCPNCGCNMNNGTSEIILLYPRKIGKTDGDGTVAFKGKHNELSLCRECYNKPSSLKFEKIKIFLTDQKWTEEEIILACEAIFNLTKGWKMIGYTTEAEMIKVRAK